MYVGLDPSTSCVGVSIVELNQSGDDVVPLLLKGITFKSSCRTLYDKYDVVKEELESFKQQVQTSPILGVYIEDVVLGFKQDRSSAGTIVTLAKFNAMVSIAARDVFGVDPVHTVSQTARKDCGLKLQQPSKCGKSHKEQVFERMAETHLKNTIWPLNKAGNIVAWSRDATDAYVIARSGALVRSRLQNV